MLHSDRWEPYPFSTRDEQTTKPYLGSNAYAVDREIPPIPWKPNTQEDAEFENMRAYQAAQL